MDRLVAMIRFMVVVMLVASAACVDAPPDVSVSVADDGLTMRCESMACDYILCESCTACGHPETTCSCGTWGPAIDDLGSLGTSVPCAR
jgi:hypothetical protein